LVGWARTVPLSEYRKSPRGPKKPKPKKASGAKIKHVATAKIWWGPKVIAVRPTSKYIETCAR
jgi:hypothetical protein